MSLIFPSILSPIANDITLHFRSFIHRKIELMKCDFVRKKLFYNYDNMKGLFLLPWLQWTPMLVYDSVNLSEIKRFCDREYWKVIAGGFLLIYHQILFKCWSFLIWCTRRPILLKIAFSKLKLSKFFPAQIVTCLFKVYRVIPSTKCFFAYK